MAATIGTGAGRDFRGRAFSVDRDMTGLAREFPRNSRGSAEYASLARQSSERKSERIRAGRKSKKECRLLKSDRHYITIYQINSLRQTYADNSFREIYFRQIYAEMPIRNKLIRISLC